MFVLGLVHMQIVFSTLMSVPLADWPVALVIWSEKHAKRFSISLTIVRVHSPPVGVMDLHSQSQGVPRDARSNELRSS